MLKFRERHYANRNSLPYQLLAGDSVVVSGNTAANNTAGFGIEIYLAWTATREQTVDVDHSSYTILNTAYNIKSTRSKIPVADFLWRSFEWQNDHRKHPK